MCSAGLWVTHSVTQHANSLVDQRRLANPTDYEEAVEGMRHGYQDVKAGRTKPAAGHVI